MRAIPPLELRLISEVSEAVGVAKGGVAPVAARENGQRPAGAGAAFSSASSSGSSSAIILFVGKKIHCSEVEFF